MTTQPSAKGRNHRIFQKIFIWNSSILVALEYVFLIWSRLQISWHHLVTEYAGVISDRTSCGAKILECGVLQNMWIRGKKATFLDSGQICLAMSNYMKRIDHQTLGRPIQVNGAFYSIKKSRVILKSNPRLHGDLVHVTISKTCLFWMPICLQVAS